MSRKTVIVSALVLSVILSGCSFNDLKSLVNTEQVKTAKPSWKVNGNSYSTSVTYEIPEGEESNTFTLVLENNLIKSIKVDISTNGKASLKYQQGFADNISKVIVGKSLSTLTTIDRVSGASLTTNAFNKALSELKQQLGS